MIGMDLLSFLILLVIGIVVAAILHYGFRFYVIPGTSSFLGKVVIGWLGAWLGSLAFVLLAVDVAKSVGSIDLHGGVASPRR